jgi:LAO/AO transport system kinase
VPVRAVSALTDVGIDAVWDDVARFRATLETSGDWRRRRAEQARAALWTEIGDGLQAQFRAAPQIASRLADIEREIMAGVRTPADGARELLRSFVRG